LGWIGWVGWEADGWLGCVGRGSVAAGLAALGWVRARLRDVVGDPCFFYDPATTETTCRTEKTGRAVVVWRFTIFGWFGKFYFNYFGGIHCIYTDNTIDYYMFLIKKDRVPDVAWCARLMVLGLMAVCRESCFLYMAFTTGAARGRHSSSSSGRHAICIIEPVGIF